MARSVAMSSMKSVPSSMASSISLANSGSEFFHALKFFASPPAALAAADSESPTAKASRKAFRRLYVRTNRDMDS